jgi:hypothetical protein
MKDEKRNEKWRTISEITISVKYTFINYSRHMFSVLLCQVEKPYKVLPFCLRIMMEIAGFSTFLLHIMFMDRRALFVGCY